MNRNESFPALGVTDMIARMAWASLTLQVDNTQEIQVLVAGSDEDTEALRITCAEGLLTVEQPGLGLNIHQLKSEAWLQVTIRLPRSWKGAVEASTVTGPLSLSGLTGTDLAFATVSGPMQAKKLQSIRTSLKTVSGSVTACDLAGERLSLRTVSGKAELSSCGFSAYKISSVSGEVCIQMDQGFDQLEAVTVSGNVSLLTPLEVMDAALRSASGKLVTHGVVVGPCASAARMTSVSGQFEINCSQCAAIYEEE